MPIPLAWPDLMWGSAEGVVSKKRDAPYVSGECKAWVKSKCAEWREENKERGRLFEEAQLTTTTGRGRR